MSQMHDGKKRGLDDDREDDLEQLLLGAIPLTTSSSERPDSPKAASSDEWGARSSRPTDGSDVQGALGLFAEASQDMATATVELSLGRHFACVDFCNQAAEKAAQAVSLLRMGHRSMYDHDLQRLGSLVGAPQEIQDEMAQLTPFHPEAFYADTPPEEADAVINAEQASYYVKCARKVLRWAKTLVLVM